MNAVLYRRALTLLALSASATGCATSGSEGVPGGPEACVIVDNSEGNGSQARMFLVSSMDGWRLGMGEVGMGRTLEYCTQRVTSPQRVRIIIERPSNSGQSSLNSGRSQGRASPEFMLRTDDVWTWDLVLNRMSRSMVIR
jgi:hypothetical protein